MTDQVLLSRREAARALAVSLRTLDTLIATRQLVVRRIGSRCLIPRTELEKFARSDHQTRRRSEQRVAQALTAEMKDGQR